MCCDWLLIYPFYLEMHAILQFVLQLGWDTLQTLPILDWGNDKACLVSSLSHHKVCLSCQILTYTAITLNPICFSVSILEVKGYGKPENKLENKKTSLADTDALRHFACTVNIKAVWEFFNHKILTKYLLDIIQKNTFLYDKHFRFISYYSCNHLRKWKVFISLLEIIEHI